MQISENPNIKFDWWAENAHFAELTYLVNLDRGEIEKVGSAVEV